MFVLCIANSPPEEEPSTPTECTDSNKGHCQCGNVADGFTTYTFSVSGVKRCFTVYHPLSRASEALPVVLTSQCYGKDRLSSIGMTNYRTDQNKAAARYGFSRIGLSTPDGNWEFGNNGMYSHPIVKSHCDVQCHIVNTLEIPN